jgi:phage repressor protein C with HTH and peptisase S24 domain
MIPAFNPRERVITYNWSTFKPGSVIVFNNGTKVLVKRIDKIDGNKVYVSGDNKKLSAKVGPISFEDIIGRVFIKY